MPWNVENYYIVDDRALFVEITIPLMKFYYTDIEDVKREWLEMLDRFIKEQPGFDMSWEMQPKDENALVTIKIAKVGQLDDFTDAEARGALDAADALFENEE